MWSFGVRIPHLQIPLGLNKHACLWLYSNACVHDLSCERAKLLEEHPHAICRYNLTKWAIQLNELTPGLKEKLAPTDCRLRPDQHYTELGEYDKVNTTQAQVHSLIEFMASGLVCLTFSAGCRQMLRSCGWRPSSVQRGKQRIREFPSSHAGSNRITCRWVRAWLLNMLEVIGRAGKLANLRAVVTFLVDRGIMLSSRRRCCTAEDPSNYLVRPPPVSKHDPGL